MNELKGICVALCTPYSADGTRVDYDTLRRLIDAMLEAGMPIISLCGGTAEYMYLTDAERRKIVEVGMKHIDGRAKVVVQTSSMRVGDIVEASLHAEGLGADAVLVLPPYYEGPGDEGVLWFYEAIGKAIHTPIMAYNSPAGAGYTITAPMFQRMLQIEHVDYIKDNSGDYDGVLRLIRSGAPVFNANDQFSFEALAAGANGCFWGGATAQPAEAVQLYDLVTAGKLVEAAALWKRMLPLNLFFMSHAYIAAVKAATDRRVCPVGPARLPNQPLSAAELEELDRVVAVLDGGSANR